VSKSPSWGETPTSQELRRFLQRHTWEMNGISDGSRKMEYLLQFT